MSPTQTATPIAIDFLEDIGADSQAWCVTLHDGTIVDAARPAFFLAAANVVDVAAAINAAKAGDDSPRDYIIQASVLCAHEALLDLEAVTLEATIAQHRGKLAEKLSAIDAAITKAEAWRDRIAQWKILHGEWTSIRDKSRAIIAEATPGVPLNEEEAHVPDAAARAALEVELAEHRSEVCRDRAEVALAAVDVALAELELETAKLCQTVGRYGAVTGVRGRIRLFVSKVEHAAAVAGVTNPS